MIEPDEHTRAGIKALQNVDVSEDLAMLKKHFSSNNVEKLLTAHEETKKVITELRSEAEALRMDTLVSMVEGVYNEIIADKLDYYADRLEKANGG